MNTFAAGFFFVPAVVVTLIVMLFIAGRVETLWLDRIKPGLKRRGWL